jgi:hypothetical protein
MDKINMQRWKLAIKGSLRALNVGIFWGITPIVFYIFFLILLTSNAPEILPSNMIMSFLLTIPYLYITAMLFSLPYTVPTWLFIFLPLYYRRTHYLFFYSRLASILIGIVFGVFMFFFIPMIITRLVPEASVIFLFSRDFFGVSTYATLPITMLIGGITFDNAYKHRHIYLSDEKDDGNNTPQTNLPKWREV